MTDFKSEDYIRYRINRAKEILIELDNIIALGYWNTAINRMYYACFYAVSALLSKYDLEVSSHSGIRQKFGENFVKTGKFDKYLAKHFTDLAVKRNQGDYNDFFDFSEESVKELFPLTIEFVSQVIELIQD